MSRVFCDLSTTAYHTPGHPEAPERISRSQERLKAAGHAVLLPAINAASNDVALLHAPDHFKRVKEGDYSDADTPHYKGMESIALKSLSGAISAAKSAGAGEPAFSLMRPPGHHAGKNRVAGFCYFNNLALACEKLRIDKKTGPIAILDIDVHHGDGTEELLQKRAGFLFCSLHQDPLYPGTGLKSHDNCHNFPLPPGTVEANYLKVLEQALRLIGDFKPELLAVSAGFDTYRECPIAQLKLEKKTYTRIGRMLSEMKLKRFAVLEGGYAEDLPLLIENFLDGFFY